MGYCFLRNVTTNQSSLEPILLDAINGNPVGLMERVHPASKHSSLPAVAYLSLPLEDPVGRPHVPHEGRLLLRPMAAQPTVESRLTTTLLSVMPEERVLPTVDASAVGRRANVHLVGGADVVGDNGETGDLDGRRYVLGLVCRYRWRRCADGHRRLRWCRREGN